MHIDPVLDYVDPQTDTDDDAADLAVDRLTWTLACKYN